MNSSVYYTIVVNINDKNTIKENVLIDYDNDYLRIKDIFLNICDISQKNIFSENVISVVLKRIIIESNNIVTKDVMKITKNDNWKLKN